MPILWPFGEVYCLADSRYARGLARCDAHVVHPDGWPVGPRLIAISISLTAAKLERE
jgi:hypothetical protein